MNCTHCGHNDWVTIGQTKYCAHCGEPAIANTKTAAATPVQPSVVAIETPAIVESQPIAPVAITPKMPAPSVNRRLSDIKPTAVAPTAAAINPAHAYHDRNTGAPAGALDLRPMKTTAAILPQPIAAIPERQVVAAPTQNPAIITQPSAARAARAATIPKSPAITRFTPQPKTLVAAPPAPAEPEPSIVTPEPTVIMPSPKPEVVPALSQEVINELPNQVLSQLKSMQSLIPPTAGPKPKKERSDRPRKAASIAAAGMATAIMAGYIWLNNYDSLTVQAAAQKAGIAATAPSYLPASYSLAGPISFGSGFVSMQYKSPANNQLVSINQRKSDWTAASLLELYVNKEAKSYLSVQSQGLTIYLLDNNQATWVNRGIQYVLQGNSQLNREQLLKIAESL